MANMKVNLKIWRQAGPKAQGGFVTYENVETDSDTSFLETLDILNETLVEQGEEPIVFDHDCREGICGMCSLYQRTSPRPRNRCHHLPALYASLQRWRNHHRGTLALCRFPRD